MSEALTTQEAARLAELEAIIENNVALMGKPLFEIRESRLYKQTHGTFEEYCRARFSMDRRYINMQIKASEVIENLGTSGSQNLPSSERQARPLAKLPAEQQPAAWEKAQEKAKEEGKPVAARHVEAAVAEVMPKDEPETVVVDEVGTRPARSNIKVMESNGMAIYASAKCVMDRLSNKDAQWSESLAAMIQYCERRIKSKK